MLTNSKYMIKKLQAGPGGVTWRNVSFWRVRVRS